MNKQLLAITLMTVMSLFGAFTQLNNTEISELQNNWESWKVQHNKVYADEAEEHYRFAVWVNTRDSINKNNQAGNTHVEALNKFSDLTKAEFRQLHLTGYIPTEKKTEVEVDTKRTHGDGIDWIQRGAVTQVKDQGYCGSCWAFGTVGGMEGRYFLETGNLQQFSEQQITSCDNDWYGCNGGNLAYDYIHDNGLESERDYPYTSGEGQTGRCKAESSRNVIQQGTVGYSDNGRDKTGYLNALDTQPLGTCLAAGAFQSYSSGILSNQCDNQVDHCVTSVGYDLGAGWARIKNSWASDWGEEGFVRISLSDDAPRHGYCVLYGNTQVVTYSG